MGDFEPPSSTEEADSRKQTIVAEMDLLEAKNSKKLTPEERIARADRLNVLKREIRALNSWIHRAESKRFLELDRLRAENEHLRSENQRLREKNELLRDLLQEKKVLRLKLTKA